MKKTFNWLIRLALLILTGLALGNFAGWLWLQAPQ